jgi:hypothetical protein
MNKKFLNIISRCDSEEVEFYLKHVHLPFDKWYIYAAITSCDYDILEMILAHFKKLLTFPSDSLFFMLEENHELSKKEKVEFTKLLLKYTERPLQLVSESLKQIEKEEHQKNRDRVLEVAKCAKRKGLYDCVNEDICLHILNML